MAQTTPATDPLTATAPIERPIRLPRRRRQPAAIEATATVPTAVLPAVALLQAHLIGHATSTCHATCDLCVRTIAYLEPLRAVPIGVELMRTANRGGRVTR